MRKRLLPAAAAAIVAVGLVSVGAAAPDAPSADLSTAVEELIATEVLPADVTGEDGEWNFAGPASECPGPGWNCETPDGPVVQTGTVNVLVATPDVCSGSSQTGDVNQMLCVSEVQVEQDPNFAHQTCGTEEAPIQQGPGHNELICQLVYDVTSEGPTQCVLQEVHFTQEGLTNKFKGQLRIVQQMTSGGTQTQDARQRITGEQNAAQKNESEIEEVEIQKLTGSATAQNQNTGCPTTEVPPPGDCNPAATGPETPYTCVHLTQTVAEGGENISKLKQEVKEDADTTAPIATETQGQPTGGNDGAVHQQVGAVDDSLTAAQLSGSGKSLGVADQYTYQTLPNRIALTQRQFEDPSCCFESQLGGGGDPEETENEEVITQVVQQLAGPFAIQNAEATGSSTSPNGGCTVSHKLENGGGIVDNSQTQEPCVLLVIVSDCANGVEGGCFTTCPPGEPFNEETGQCEEEPIGTDPPITILSPPE